jgi:hypothetical protein
MHPCFNQEGMIAEHEGDYAIWCLSAIKYLRQDWFGKIGVSGSSGLDLSGLPSVLQAPLFDCVAFDPFSL